MDVDSSYDSSAGVNRFVSPEHFPSSAGFSNHLQTLPMDILSGVFFTLSLLVVSLILVHGLKNEINPTILSNSFVRRQLIYAFLLLPVLDILARLWILQPFVPILALFSACFAGASAAIIFLLQKLVLFANQFLVMMTSTLRIAEYTRDEIFSPKLIQNFQNFSRSTEEVFSSVNYTQLAEHFLETNDKYQKVSAENLLNTTTNLFQSSIVKETRKNLSEILVHSLSAIQFTDFVKNGDVFEYECSLFDQLKKSLVSIVNIFSQDDMSFEGEEKHFSTARKIVNELQTVLGRRAQQIGTSLDLPEVDAITLHKILGVISGQQSIKEALLSLTRMSPTTKDKNSIQLSDAFNFVTFNPRVFAAILILVLFSIPVMYIGRALLQSYIQWNLSKTYRRFGNETDRRIDGYILTGGLTGIGFGTAQATIQTLLWAFIPFPILSKLVLFFHCFMLIVIHCVTQMAIGGAEGRRDLIGGWKGRTGWWILTTIVHVVFGMWWAVQYFAALVCAAINIGLDLRIMVLSDAVVCGLFVWWAKRICRMARNDERNSLKHE
ncbi:unnamed protein product [Agarophyton chilense]|eukprot:gb/GEZJ01002426.1/.p1 GENE.gb/GEZJ01002426.1/~~gb/GEZJ01002426.1/.p1  ORF type:complete len:550 (-),score=61.44 gb/GEZJ01002426.1/:335-1984(-)